MTLVLKYICDDIPATFAENIVVNLVGLFRGEMVPSTSVGRSRTSSSSIWAFFLFTINTSGAVEGIMGITRSLRV